MGWLLRYKGPGPRIQSGRVRGPEAEVEAVAKVVKEEMEGVAELAVPLVVTWGGRKAGTRRRRKTRGPGAGEPPLPRRALPPPRLHRRGAVALRASRCRSKTSDSRLPRMPDRRSLKPTCSRIHDLHISCVASVLLSRDNARFRVGLDGMEDLLRQGWCHP